MLSILITSNQTSLSSRFELLLNLFESIGFECFRPPRQNVVYHFWWLFFSLVCDNLACEMYASMFVVIRRVLYIINNLIRCWRHTNSYALTSIPPRSNWTVLICLHWLRVLRDIVGITVIMIIAIIVPYFVIANQQIVEKKKIVEFSRPTNVNKNIESNGKHFIIGSFATI